MDGIINEAGDKFKLKEKRNRKGGFLSQKYISSDDSSSDNSLCDVSSKKKKINNSNDINFVKNKIIKNDDTETVDSIDLNVKQMKEVKEEVVNDAAYGEVVKKIKKKKTKDISGENDLLDSKKLEEVSSTVENHQEFDESHVKKKKKKKKNKDIDAVEENLNAELGNEADGLENKLCVDDESKKKKKKKKRNELCDNEVEIQGKNEEICDSGSKVEAGSLEKKEKTRREFIETNGTQQESVAEEMDTDKMKKKKKKKKRERDDLETGGLVDDQNYPIDGQNIDSSVVSLSVKAENKSHESADAVKVKKKKKKSAEPGAEDTLEKMEVSKEESDATQQESFAVEVDTEVKKKKKKKKRERDVDELETGGLRNEQNDPVDEKNNDCAVASVSVKAEDDKLHESADSVKIKKKKKKSREPSEKELIEEHEVKTEDRLEKMEIDREESTEPAIKIKKKKRKHHNSENSELVNEQNDTAENVPVKKKKKKHHNELGDKESAEEHKDDAADTQLLEKINSEKLESAESADKIENKNSEPGSVESGPTQNSLSEKNVREVNNKSEGESDSDDGMVLNKSSDSEASNDETKSKSDSKPRQSPEKKQNISESEISDEEDDEDYDEEEIVPRKRRHKSIFEKIPVIAKMLTESDDEEDELQMQQLNLTESKKLAELRINLIHHVLPQHNIEKNAGTRPLSKEEKKRFESYAPLRTGTFTPDEDNRICHNWKRFCKVHDWRKALVHPFIFRKRKGFYFLSKVEERRKFVQFLAHALPNRSLYSVYGRFKNLYSTHKQSRYTKEEDAIVLKIINDPTVKHPLKVLAKRLNRTQQSVWRRIKLLQKKSGSDNSDNE
ncbi:glutamic acid-rich protein-like [Microplitis mediator]|uniref:glutamic acid-rich protein-like n=1 Tax=Microplitis mediator TaxID=375433 RepID=UPI002553715E|nr:glutamic acid-rich protein-like [Microplitis mediator]